MPIHNLHYFESENNDVLNIILNWFNDTSKSEFISLLFDCCRENNQSVIAFDYEFQYLKQNTSSWSDLEIESKTLDQVIKQYAWKYERINFIAKSLWAIVLSKYLSKNELKKDYTVKILWYIHDDIDMASYINKVSIVQWERDRFWSPKEISQKIEDRYWVKVEILNISWWDHSYRNEDKTSLVWQEIITQFIIL